MTLWEQWELVNFIANKDYGGNVIEPDRFNQLVKVANLDLLKVKFGLPEDYQLGAPLSRQYLDATQRLTDETRFLKVVLWNQSVLLGETLQLPDDYFTLASLRYTYQRNIDGAAVSIKQKVELLTESEADDRLSNWTKQPTAKDPIAVVTGPGPKGYLQFYPESTVNVVDIRYIRYPTDPVFAYTTQTGYITYDSGNSTEYEWGGHLHMDLTRMIMGYIGINMREDQLEQYAEIHKQQGV